MKSDDKQTILAFVEQFFGSDYSKKLVTSAETVPAEKVDKILETIAEDDRLSLELQKIVDEIFSGAPLSDQEISDCLGLPIIEQRLTIESQERVFEKELERLPDELAIIDKIPAAVWILAESDNLSVVECIEKMDIRLGELKKARLGVELPWTANISAEERRNRKQEIVADHDYLKSRLVESLESFPGIWSSAQEVIAHIEPISDISRSLDAWKRDDGLKKLAKDIYQSSGYKALYRYEHPLLEIRTLSQLIEQDYFDIEAIVQALWILTRGEGRPGANIITNRLTRPLLRFFPEFAVYLENIVDSSKTMSMRERARFYSSIESVVSAIPSNRKNKQLAAQDLAWRAVLLDKARQHSKAAELANDALVLASRLESPPKNPFLWWSRLGSAHFFVAKVSNDPNNSSWSQGRLFYEESLRWAFEKSKGMVYLRQAQSVVEQASLIEARSFSVEAIPLFFDLLDEGIRFIAKALDNIERPESALFMKARIESMRASAAKILGLEEGDSFEELFLATIDELLAIRPNHIGAINLRSIYILETGDVVGSLDSLDKQIQILRNDDSDQSTGIVNYLEFRAAEIALEFGQEEEARSRLMSIVVDTQPNNSEAWELLGQLGFSIPNEEIVQELYRQARQKIPGSEDRARLTEEAIRGNQYLVDSDPGMSDAAPWTRQARLLLFKDDFASALDILEKLKTKFPSDPYIQFHLGEAFYRRGVEFSSSGNQMEAVTDYEKATLAYERAWDLEERVDTAHRLSSCWSRRGDVSNQSCWLEKAEKLDPSDGWTKLYAAWAKYRSGMFAEAFRYWVDSVQCFAVGSLDSDRHRSLGSLAAKSVVRYGETRSDDEIRLEYLSADAIRMIASAASGVGWRYSKVIERFGRCLDIIPMRGLLRIPHAVRAHLLYRQLVNNDDHAYSWHTRWFENFKALKNRSLLVEYAAGGKGVFRRAAAWSILSGKSFQLSHEIERLEDEIDWGRWGEFIDVASVWGVRSDYYKTAYAAFPRGAIECEELFTVLRMLNYRIFLTAVDEQSGGVSESISEHYTKILARFPIELEVLPAKEFDSDAPESILVHTDELSSQILLHSTNKILETNGVSNVRKSWRYGGETLCCSFRNGKDFDSLELYPFFSSISRSHNSIRASQEEGLTVCWQIWG